MANEDFANLQEVVDAAGKLLVDAMADQILAQGLFATGELARSVTYQPIPVQDGVIGFQILMEDYGIYQNDGFFRPPGKRPPLQPIIDWLQRKQITPKPDPITNKTPSIREFAFLIQRKIGNEGATIKARPFIQPAVDGVVNNFLTPKLEEAGIKDIENSIAVAVSKNDKMKVK